VLALYGFPSAVSKMVSDVNSEGKGISFLGFYMPVFLILLSMNGIFFLFLFLNAHHIAEWIADTSLTSSYGETSFIFLLIPIIELMRRGFKGNHYMQLTAYSQLGEQIVKDCPIIMF